MNYKDDIITHIVSTSEGLHFSKVHLRLGTNVFIEMIHEEIIRKVGPDVDLKTTSSKHILENDNGKPFIRYYSLAHAKAQLYLGKNIDIESLVVNYLTKRKLDIIKKDDIENVCKDLGIYYPSWHIMYNDYLMTKSILNIPDTTDTINIIHVLLHRHLNRLYSWNY